MAVARAAHSMTGVGLAAGATEVGEARIEVRTVNGRALETYFPTDSLRTQALRALSATQTVGKYDIRVNVSGGGPNGQAGAVSLGIARALLESDVNFKAALRADGLLTRDPRIRERKKYGQPGARKRFQFSKR